MLDVRLINVVRLTAVKHTYSQRKVASVEILSADLEIKCYLKHYSMISTTASLRLRLNDTTE